MDHYFTSLGKLYAPETFGELPPKNNISSYLQNIEPMDKLPTHRSAPMAMPHYTYAHC
jgi:hypothetical protein